LGTAALTKELQPAKASLPMILTDSGTSTAVKEQHPLKASAPISVISSPKTPDFRELQDRKQPLATQRRELGT
jgi:hypothetical protein